MTPAECIICLSQAGLDTSVLEWIGPDRFRWGHWRPLPAEGQWALLSGVEEEVYEDWDGDGDGGRPLCYTRYTYRLLTNS